MYLSKKQRELGAFWSESRQGQLTATRGCNVEQGTTGLERHQCFDLVIS